MVTRIAVSYIHTAVPESTNRRAVASRAAPGLLIALSLNGFFLYLGLLDLLDIEPQPKITGLYYLALGLALVAMAYTRRDLLWIRLLGSGRTFAVWTTVGALLAAWFLVTATLRSEGLVARNAAVLLLVFALPTALVTLALRRDEVPWLAYGLVASGLAFVVVSAATLATLDERSSTFSPIRYLDPISAAKTAALGALALLALHPRSQHGRTAHAVTVALLVAATVLPGARGPLLALGLGVAIVTAVSFRRLPRLLLPAVAIGFVLGLLAAERAGSTYHLGFGIPGIEREQPTGVDYTGERLPPAVLGLDPISSTDIRRALMGDALRAIPDAPLLGHGVGMLRDTSEDTRRMLEAGRITEAETLTHPHNVLIESAYSLGLPGLGLFVALVISAAIALAWLIRACRHCPDTLLAAGFGAAAAVNSSVSGELGMDAYVWVALVLPVALYMARREATASSK